VTPVRTRAAVGAATLAVAVAALTTSCGGSPSGSSGTVRPAAAPASNAPSAPTRKGFRSSRQVVVAPEPTSLRIPRIGMSGPLERLGRGPDGAVGVPKNYGVAGWYGEGTRPGDLGSAVILGHVDAPSGPAVFARLRTLRAGDRVVVGRRDGSSVGFVVDRVERHPRAAFPTLDVYFPTAAPQLRLVTCTGAYVRGSGYQANLVVYASQRGPS
jgi:hypothetical protein